MNNSKQLTTTNSIKDLNVTLDELYKAENKQLNISLSDKDYSFTVILKSNDEVDCKISSFRGNIYARTNKGMNYERYKSLATLQSALVKLIQNKIDTSGDITFYVADEVYTI